MFKIVTEPNLILHKKSLAVSIGDIKAGKFNGLIDNMVKTMIKSDGVGLAAPQIGKSMHLAIVSMNPERRDSLQPKAFFNPTITFESKEKKVLHEGCLSVPKQYGLIKRAAKIRVKAIDQNGDEVKIKAKGLLAQIFQHEIDHLNGQLYIEKVESME